MPILQLLVAGCRGRHRRTAARGFAPWVSRSGGTLAIVALAVALIAVIASVTFAVAGTPGHDPANGSWVGGLRLAPGPENLVLWTLPGSGGRLGTCIDADANGPLHGPYTKQSELTDAVYGELNHLFATASTSDVRLAELSALNSRKYDRVDRAVQWSYLANGQGGTSVADANAMLAEAADRAGPYSVSVTWPASDTVAGTHYSATVSVTSAAGTPVPDARVTLSATNAALASAGVSTDRDGRAVIGFMIGSGTASTFSISAAVQSWTHVDTYASPAEQTMLVAGPPSTQAGQHTGPVDRNRPVELIKVRSGDPTNTPQPGYVYRIEDSSGHVVAPSVTTGASAQDAPLGSLSTGATYRATEIGAPPGATLYIPAQPVTSFTVPPGTDTWTVIAHDPSIPAPTIGTRVNLQNALVGQRLSDTVTVGGDDGEDGTIDATLYGPVPPPQQGSCSDLALAAYQAAPAQQFTEAVRGASNDGNGDYLIAGPLLTRAGCWGWAEKLTLSPSGATATSAPTAPRESAQVTAPTLATTASAQIAAPGSVLSDRVVVTGMNGQSGTLTATLYGPMPPDATGCGHADDSSWHAAFAARGSVLVAGTATVPVTGDGPYVVAPVAVSAPGCYTYGERLTPSSTPTAPVTTRLGVRSESTIVLAPTLHTAVVGAISNAAGIAAIAAGSPMRDAVTVGGMTGESGAIGGALLGPVAARGGSCSGLSWAHAAVAATIGELAISRDGTVVTPAVTARIPGCYTFVEALLVGGLAAPIAATSAGEPAETVLVYRPTVPGAPHAPRLATTGTPVRVLAIAGGVLLAVGAAALLAARRRRS